MITMDQHRENIVELASLTGQEITVEFLDSVIRSCMKTIRTALGHGNTTDEKIAEMKDLAAAASIMKREI